MRTELQADLDWLEASFQELGDVASRAIRGAVDALQTQDVELCDEVIAFDDEIDDRHMAIENQIQLVLARQTPVASDLRLVLAREGIEGASESAENEGAFLLKRGFELVELLL